ncbi:MAG: UDP-4-amino-4,6-dideoxy-N-acetyl-beta-L-altrosamine transaminase [Candidatus Saganbacteria bacterium]|nr:UDP-4-amino-4,6-dideoxy-N-acetyl-beta-L-altrosamine transaminase [Candidatus Saganbacteria bacterium]
MLKLKTIPYATQWIDADDIKAVLEILKSDWLTQGPKVKEFEERVANYCGVKYAIALNSGTSALHAACFASKVGLQDEVITTPITFAASANCVLYCGGKPVFADVQEDTLNIDPEEIKKKITSKTKAIIPVHFAGHPCDLEKIYAIAKDNKLIVIEDAAHALGAEYKSARIGSCTYSDMTILSFHAVKHITTGEGGMVLTNNEELFKKIVMFRTHGITKDQALLENKDEGCWYYEMQDLGFNYRITDFQCALGLSQLKKLDLFVNRRREIVAQYNQAFNGLANITVPIEKSDVKSSWHIYPVRFKGERKNIFNKLREKGIGVNVHYLPVYFQPYYRSLGYQTGICPKAEAYYSQAVTLPLYPKMSYEDINYVIESVVDILEGAKR